MQADKPLVTFALIAFNQEEYIADAIAAALAQTYQPLQIILSDDASKDRTFEIMKEMAGRYRGPHQVILNRNERNLGTGAHINTLMELCTADFVVIAAGDDVSLPDRTERLTSAWLSSGRRAKSVHSKASCIDELSREIGKAHQGQISTTCASVLEFAECGKGVLGATQGWDMEVFRKFGPLLHGADLEDVVIPLRALLLGEIRFVDEALVRYRVGTGVSQPGHAHRRLDQAGRKPLALLRRRYRTRVQMCCDLERAGGHQDSIQCIRPGRIKALQELWLARNGKLTPARLRLFRTVSTSSEMLRLLARYRFPRFFGAARRFQAQLRQP